jgi:hypothetical protein
MYKDNIEEMKSYFHFYYSKKKFDYVAKNGVHHRCSLPCDVDHKFYWSNLPFAHNIVFKDDSSCIGTFGCSYTFGDGLKEDETWPYLLEKEKKVKVLNFGTSGAGIDSIYMNIISSSYDYSFDKIIILLPNLSRKISRFFYNGNWFRWVVLPSTGPVGWDGLLPFPVGEYLKIDNELFYKKGEKVLRSIVKDKDQRYSKKLIKKIIKFCDKRYKKYILSTWSKETLDYLKKEYEDNTIIYYDSAGPLDSNNHPGIMQNQRFVNLLTELL